jgi:probable rRNA maturation factor
LIDVEVEDPAWTAALPEAETLVRMAADAALALLHRPEEDGGGGPRPKGGVEGAKSPDLRASGLEPPPSLRDTSPVVFATREEQAAVTVLLTDDATIRELNGRFRDQDKATNVLSFPAPPNPEDHLGDVALAFGVCAREAQEQGKPLAHHLQHLVAHGVLHLLGYDHETDAQAEEMEGLERVLLAGLGIADPYLTAPS